MPYEALARSETSAASTVRVRDRQRAHQMSAGHDTVEVSTRALKFDTKPAEPLRPKKRFPAHPWKFPDHREPAGGRQGSFDPVSEERVR